MDEPIRPRRPDDILPCDWCGLPPDKVTGKCSTCGRSEQGQTDTASERPVEEVA